MAIAGIALAGCSAVNPITTTLHYAASDGLQVQIGDARGLNLLVVTTAAGAPAVLTGSVYNPDSTELTLTISIDGKTTTNVTVPAGMTTQLGPEAGQVLVTGAAPVAPGLIAQITISSSVSGSFATPVPVVDGTLPQYQKVLADAAAKGA
jgi:hypothetical protein